jgi:hypothetical protein
MLAGQPGDAIDAHKHVKLSLLSTRIKSGTIFSFPSPEAAAFLSGVDNHLHRYTTVPP